MKKSAVFLLILTALSLFACSNHELYEQEKAGALRAYCFENAGALFLKAEAGTVLINTGGREESRMVLQTLKEQQISRIDLLVLSSFSESALGGAARIIENLEIGAVYEPSCRNKDDAARQYYEALSSKDIIPVVLSENVQLTAALDGVLSLYISDDRMQSSLDRTVAVKAELSGRRIVFFPDLQESALSHFINKGYDWSCDFLFIPKGWNQQSLDTLISLTRPAAVALSCSEQEPAEADEQFAAVGCTVYHLHEERTCFICAEDNLIPEPTE